jgi:hypothetical protein
LGGEREKNQEQRPRKFEVSGFEFLVSGSVPRVVSFRRVWGWCAIGLVMVSAFLCAWCCHEIERRAGTDAPYQRVKLVGFLGFRDGFLQNAVETKKPRFDKRGCGRFDDWQAGGLRYSRPAVCATGLSRAWRCQAIVVAEVAAAAIRGPAFARATARQARTRTMGSAGLTINHQPSTINRATPSQWRAFPSIHKASGD